MNSDKIIIDELRRAARFVFAQGPGHGPLGWPTVFLSPMSLGEKAYSGLRSVMPGGYYVEDQDTVSGGYIHRSFALLLAAEVLENPA